jgi:hypothetical protein
MFLSYSCRLRHYVVYESAGCDKSRWSGGQYFFFHLSSGRFCFVYCNLATTFCWVALEHLIYRPIDIVRWLKFGYIIYIYIFFILSPFSPVFCSRQRALMLPGSPPLPLIFLLWGAGKWKSFLSVPSPSSLPPSHSRSPLCLALIICVCMWV